MDNKSDILAMMRQSFEDRWKPTSKDYLRIDFSIDLDRLIYAAFAAAQAPYIRELELFREYELSRSRLMPTPHLVKP